MENEIKPCGCDKFNLLVFVIWVILFVNFPPKSMGIFVLWGIGLIAPAPLIHWIWCKLNK